MEPKRNRHENRRSELGAITCQFAGDLFHVPLEPASLSLVHTSANLESPLSLRVVAPSAVRASELELEVSQHWCYPFRLVRVIVRLPPELLSLDSADVDNAIQSFMGSLKSEAYLYVPCSLTRTEGELAPRIQTLPKKLSNCNGDPRYGRCVLIEIAVPAAITLYPAAAITLIVCVAASPPVTLLIPARGHIHSAACNHKRECREGRGGVFDAARAGDAAALEAVLAAGCSTEETDEDEVILGWRGPCSHECGKSGLTLYLLSILFAVATLQNCTALIAAAMEGHVEAVRILVAAGANVHAKDNVCVCRGRRWERAVCEALLCACVQHGHGRWGSIVNSV